MKKYIARKKNFHITLYMLLYLFFSTISSPVMGQCDPLGEYCPDDPVIITNEETIEKIIEIAKKSPGWTWDKIEKAGRGIKKGWKAVKNFFNPSEDPYHKQLQKAIKEAEDILEMVQKDSKNFALTYEEKQKRINNLLESAESIEIKLTEIIKRTSKEIKEKETALDRIEKPRYTMEDFVKENEEETLKSIENLNQKPDINDAISYITGTFKNVFKCSLKDSACRNKIVKGVDSCVISQEQKSNYNLERGRPCFGKEPAKLLKGVKHSFTNCENLTVKELISGEETGCYNIYLKRGMKECRYGIDSLSESSSDKITISSKFFSISTGEDFKVTTRYGDGFNRICDEAAGQALTSGMCPAEVKKCIDDIYKKR